MKAISLWQPYASLIGRGKVHETRSWSTSYRGPIVIHAAKRWTQDERDIYCAEPFKAALKEFWFFDQELPLGAIVAIANLVACKPTKGIKNEFGSGPKYAPWVHALSAQDRAFGDFTPGRFGWEFAHVSILPNPIPYRGAQGLFEIPDNLVVN